MCYVFLQSLQKSNQFFCFVFEIFCAIQLMQNSKKKRTFKITKSQKIIFLYESIYSMAIEKFLHLWLLGWLLQEYNPEWAVRFRYGNFTLKLACVKKSLASRGPTALGTQAFSSLGLIFGGEEISIPEPRPILEILCFCLLFLTCTILFDLNFDCIWLQYWFDILFFRNSVILDELNDTLFLQNSLLIFFYSPSPLGGDIFANALQQQAIIPQQQAKGRKIQ